MIEHDLNRITSVDEAMRHRTADLTRWKRIESVHPFAIDLDAHGLRGDNGRSQKRDDLHLDRVAIGGTGVGDRRRCGPRSPI